MLVNDKFILKLYVAGKSPKSIEAFSNLKKICEEHLLGKYIIEVIDLKENPSLAKEHSICVLPTLIKVLPLPIKKIIGILSNTEKVLVALDIQKMVLPIS